MTKHLSDLTPNPRNPRRITDKKLEMLKKSLGEFGDLGGIVLNVVSGQLCGGHQRCKAFQEANPEITIERTYKEPTKSGTIAEGYFQIDGEKFTYREVKWASKKEKAANIAANKGAGEWDLSILSDDMLDLDDGSFDMDLTMFDEEERERLVVGYAPLEDKEGAQELDQKDFDGFKHECPKCGFEWNDEKS